MDENPANVSEEESKRQFAAFVKAQQEGYRGIGHLMPGADAIRNPLPPSRPIADWHAAQRRQKLVYFCAGWIVGAILMWLAVHA